MKEQMLPILLLLHCTAPNQHRSMHIFSLLAILLLLAVVSSFHRKFYNHQYDCHFRQYPRSYESVVFRTDPDRYVDSFLDASSSKVAGGVDRCNKEKNEREDFFFNSGGGGEEIVSLLASRKSRTWRRLRHVLDLCLCQHAFLKRNDHDNDCEKTSKEEDVEDEEISVVIPGGRCASSDDSRSSGKYCRGISIADVGCDHGILTLALAVASGNMIGTENDNDYNHCLVVGVDASERALRDGAIRSMFRVLNAEVNLAKEEDNDALGRDCINDRMDRVVDDDEEKGGVSLSLSTPSFPSSRAAGGGAAGGVVINGCKLEFRCGVGLTALHDGEVDTICVAGMGVNTMLKVLFPTPALSLPSLRKIKGSKETCLSSLSSPSSEEEEEKKDSSELSRVGCQRLILQPTNTRPRNMIKLYKIIQKQGQFRLEAERIEYLSSRWFITAAFVKSEGTKWNNDDDDNGDSSANDELLLLPGAFLYKLPMGDPMKGEYLRYVRHHRKWLRRDRMKKDKGVDLSQEDQTWLAQSELWLENKE